MIVLAFKYNRWFNLDLVFIKKTISVNFFSLAFSKWHFLKKWHFKQVCLCYHTAAINFGHDTRDLKQSPFIFGAATFRTMTLRRTTFGFKMPCCSACTVYEILSWMPVCFILLSVILLIVILLSVILICYILPLVILLTAILVSVIIMSVIIMSVIIMSVIIMSVIIVSVILVSVILVSVILVSVIVVSVFLLGVNLQSVTAPCICHVPVLQCWGLY